MAVKKTKANRNTSNNFLVSTYDHSSIKKMCNQEVSLFLIVQNKGKEMFKGVCCTCKFVCLVVVVFFLLIIDLLPFSLPSTFSITRFYFIIIFLFISI